MTTPVFNSKVNFETANKYFAFVEDLPKHDKIQEEYEQLRDAIAELDPAGPHYSTLSTHRQGVLETRVASLFQTIAMKLQPIRSRPSDIIREQLETVRGFISKLEAGVSAENLRRAIKKIHPDLKSKIYYVIWVTEGGPKENHFGELKLKKDPGILHRKFPPLVTQSDGTLLEQISSELVSEYQRALYIENIDALDNISQNLTSVVSAQEIRKKISALPENIQNALFNEAARLGFRPDAHQSKMAILEDPYQLRKIKNYSHPAAHIIDQFADTERYFLNELTRRIDDQKVTLFCELLKDMKINDHIMKQFFRKLPNTAQAKVAQPPYFGRGFNPELYKTLGAHYDSRNTRTTFRVYAPNAREITLNLTAYHDVEHSLCMVKKENGIWEVDTQYAQPGRSYHFMIVGRDGGTPIKKVDPFAFGNIVHSREPGREDHESVVCEIEKNFNWSDESWMACRKCINLATTPMAIYEIHTPTWKRKINGNALNWRELAYELSRYCQEMGYTHVELMALFEHPQPISMGYQITNFFVLNSEMGTIEDFQYFVNFFHEQGLGVIADWVPAHFAIDPFSLALFDGTPLFEDDEPQFRGHPEWGTYEFDFKKQFAKDFLASQLDFMLKYFHFDAVRVDGVQSMLELNFGRAPRTRLNHHGNSVNLNVKSFLRNVNVYVHQKYPGTLMIAEEAMGFPNLTRSVSEKGIHVKKRGVDYDATWHLGFMNNVLHYFSTPPHCRKDWYSMFSRSIKEVDYDEDTRTRGGHVILEISHDQNANGNGTLFTKMAGNSDFDKFANGRCLLAFQLLRGGGPILDFMGNEILQPLEWHGILKRDTKSRLDGRKNATFQWEKLDPSDADYKYHAGARQSRKDLLHLYHINRGLQDQTDDGFSWIDATDSANGVLGIHRRGNGQQFACIFNTSDKDLVDYMIPLPDSSYAPELDRLTRIREVYNTDDRTYGGQGRRNAHVGIIRDATDRPTHLQLRLPPYSALVLEEYFS